MIKNAAIKGTSEIQHTGEIKTGKSQALQKQEKSLKSTSRYEDTFTPSQTAQELERVKEIFNTLPDIREDRVAEIKAKLSSGDYQISAEDVAERIIIAFANR